MTTIQLTFPWGRYYAHPWGINPTRLREPEWPPSPWRLLRALVSAWFRAHPGQVPDAHCIALIAWLGRELPEIGMGKVSFGHTVHFQPNFGAGDGAKKARGEYHPTRHENHFAAVHGAVFFRWRNMDLTPDLRRTLETLLAELTYFGRAESLCHAEICETEPASNDTGWCRANGRTKNLRHLPRCLLPKPRRLPLHRPVVASRRQPRPRFTGRPAALGGHAPFLRNEARWCRMVLLPNARWLAAKLGRANTPHRAPCNKPAPSAGPKVAHYLCFSLQCRVPLLPKFIVPLSEKFRAAANHHLCRVHGEGTPSFALLGHAKERPDDAKGDHQHAFYLPMSARNAAEGFLSELHVWCPYGFTQAEIEILLRINRLDWGGGKYPVRPVLTAMSNEPPSDAPFSTGRTASCVWRSASPFVPPRYFYRGSS